MIEFSQFKILLGNQSDFHLISMWKLRNSGNSIYNNLSKIKTCKVQHREYNQWHCNNYA